MLRDILDKYPGINHEVKDIPEKRLKEFAVYANLSYYTAATLGVVDTVISALVYGYILGQRDSVNLDDLE